MKDCIQDHVDKDKNFKQIHRFDDRRMRWIDLIEKVYDCSGFCQAPLSWYHKSFDEGIPNKCVDVFYSEYSPGIAGVGSFLIIMFFVTCFTFCNICLLCKTPVPDDEEDVKVHPDEQNVFPN